MQYSPLKHLCISGAIITADKASFTHCKRSSYYIGCGLTAHVPPLSCGRNGGVNDEEQFQERKQQEHDSCIPYRTLREKGEQNNLCAFREGDCEGRRQMAVMLEIPCGADPLQRAPQFRERRIGKEESKLSGTDHTHHFRKCVVQRLFE